MNREEGESAAVTSERRPERGQQNVSVTPGAAKSVKLESTLEPEPRRDPAAIEAEDSAKTNPKAA